MSAIYGDGGDDGTSACTSCDGAGWWVICPWCDKHARDCRCDQGEANMVYFYLCEDCDGQKYLPHSCNDDSLLEE